MGVFCSSTQGSTICCLSCKNHTSVLLNTLPQASWGAGVEMIPVEMEAIPYKTAQQNTFML